jgi:hypothetical protein
VRRAMQIPLHPDWDIVIDEDLDLLLNIANDLLGKFQNGLLLWIPLRMSLHLDRAKDRNYGIGHICPSTDDVAEWFVRPKSLSLLLAQCGSLVSIEALKATKPYKLYESTKLASVFRHNFSNDGWVGRHVKMI